MVELVTQGQVAEFLDVHSRHIRKLEKHVLRVCLVNTEKREPWPAAALNGTRVEQV